MPRTLMIAVMMVVMVVMVVVLVSVGRRTRSCTTLARWDDANSRICRARTKNSSRNSKRSPSTTALQRDPFIRPVARS